MTEQMTQEKYLADYKKPCFLVKQLDWTFELDADQTIVTASMDFERLEDVDTLLLDGDGLTLKWLKLDGQVLTSDRYHVTPSSLEIQQVPQTFTLTMQVAIQPIMNHALMGLYISKGIFCTQCEPHGFRRICYFLDRPDVLTYIRTKLIANKEQFPVLLSNGNCVGSGDLPDGKHWVEWDDPSLKPCYLFALVAGDFDLVQDSFVTMEGRLVDLRVYVDLGKLDQAQFAMSALKRAMKWDEETYGCAYDLDIYSIVAVSDFNQGAMENKGLNIFNSACILAKPDLATDREYQYVEGVIGHEYFHNWSGNRVTVRDWFQLSLKEGLTIFRDQGFTMAMTSPTVKRIEDVTVIRNFQFPQDAGPMAHPVQPDRYISMDNFYTVTVYNKGAEVIRMIKTIIGENAFFKGMDHYFANNDGKAVEIHDFVHSMEHVSDIDLTQFKRWYTQAGTPRVAVESTWRDSELTITLKQTCLPSPKQTKKDPFFIPFSIGLLDDNGNNLTGLELEGPHHYSDGTYVLYLSQSEQQFTFKGLKQKPRLSLLRDFSAPVIYHYDYDHSDLLFLMANDQDPFNRWDVSQRLAEHALMAAYQQGDSWKMSTDMVDVYRQVLRDETLSPGVKAEIFKIPSEKYLIQSLTPCDPIVLHRVRENYIFQLAKALEQDWVDVYKGLETPTSYEYNAEQVGRRALKNMALSQLVKTRQPEYQAWASEQYYAADNMTDRLSALMVLVEVQSKYVGDVTQSFYDQYQSEELALHKWFTAQVRSQDSCEIEFLQKLLSHKDYDGKNPNCVRAVLGAFAYNTPCFHDVSGLGYQFLTSQIIETDQFNPMLAARLCQPLTEWRLYDEKRSHLMKSALTELSEKSGLSANLYEVVTKSLQ